METDPKCKLHAEILNVYCPSCNIPICAECIASHKRKKCIDIDFLPSYFEENISPKYEEHLASLNKRRDSIETSYTTFRNSILVAKSKLIELKKKFEDMLQFIDAAIEAIPTDPISSTIFFNIASKFCGNDCDRIKEAIKKKDVGYLISKLNFLCVAFPLTTSDSELKLMEAFNKDISTVLNLKEMNSLTESAKLIVSICKKYRVKNIDTIIGENIYGIYETEKNCPKLCSYNIESKKITPLIDAYCGCAVTQIDSRIFISGGGNNAENLVYEFIKDTKILTKKCPMKYEKNNFTTEVISSTTFVTIGGEYKPRRLSCCEEYSISNNVWKELPSLDHKRRRPGSALIDNHYLYAIGGYKTDTIEMLDIIEKKEWLNISINIGDFGIEDGPVSFNMLDGKIMTFCGDDSDYAFIYDTKKKTVEKCSYDIKKDYYFSNSVSKIYGTAYIIGKKYIHAYDIYNDRLEEISCSDAIEQQITKN